VADADVLIVGGGMAGANCARTLREEGFGGSIVLCGRELDPPYNRPPCSKGHLQGTESREDTLFRPPGWWEEQAIDLRVRANVSRLDPQARTAKAGKEELSFDQALVATGANVRRLRVDGADLDGVHYLRTLGNSDTLRADLEDARYVVVVGGSFIATEVAASCVLLGKEVALLMLEDVVHERTLGRQAGRFFQRVLGEHGVEVHGGQELARFEGDGGERISKVVTAGGLELDADVVVMGTGAVPDLTLARSSGLELGELGGIRCDRLLRTSAPGIYAAGDVCEYDSVIHGGPARIEHWDVAFNQGRTAAHNMLGRERPHDVMPYFWSDLADWVSLESVGAPRSWEQEVVRGSFDDGSFAVLYLAGSRVVGCLAVGRSDDLEGAGRLIAGHVDVAGRHEALADPAIDLAALAPE